MDLQSDGVAGAVGEILAVALLLDIIPGGVVHVAHPVAGLGGSDAPAVGLQDDLINLPLAVGHGAQEHGAGHVGAVVVLQTADVQHHAIAVLAPGGIGTVVGVGGVACEGGDGLEGTAGAACVLVQLL